MISERDINVTAKALGQLNKTPEVSKWAKNRLEVINQLVIPGYDELVETLNSVQHNSPLLEYMPKTKLIKEVLGDTPLPLLQEMSNENFWLALLEARKPMIHGQDIKTGIIPNPTSEDYSFAIGTTSMETSKPALIVGTIGHLAERTFFQWAKKLELQPEGGWKKDDWLQALDEGLMLMLAVDDDFPKLEHFFTQINSLGGLGWIKSDQLIRFKEKVRPLLGK